jgi:lysozyme
VSDQGAGARPARQLAAVLAACGAAAALVVGFEGWRTTPYKDPVGILTVCDGVTRGVRADHVYTDQECAALAAHELVDHGLAIAPCLPEALPTDTRAAFTSFGYNVGAAAFCSSTLARKANAGDLAGACAELSRWTLAGGRQLPGLVKRRAAERALCERGLTQTRP